MDEALALLAEQVLGRHPHVLEGQLGRVLGVLAELVQFAAPLEALHPALGHQQADAAVALAGVGLGGHDHEVGVDAVRDEGLGTVEHVVVAVADRGGAHPRQVRADPRLGHRQRGDQLAADDPRQPALALCLVGQAQEVGQADVVVERDPEAEGADGARAGTLRRSRGSGGSHRRPRRRSAPGRTSPGSLPGRPPRTPPGGRSPRAPTLRSGPPRPRPPAPGRCGSWPGSLRGGPRTASVSSPALHEQPSHRRRSTRSQYWWETTSRGAGARPGRGGRPRRRSSRSCA